MADLDPTSLRQAIEFSLSILEPFRQSSLYDDYQDVDGWTDEHFEAALAVLHAAVEGDGHIRQDFFVVDAADPVP